ncbi:hypothetical protein PTI98_011409 [Pleurotus ostreatus]|nr:hypothetical protein PTI98_011409 [Pleurotus ostreatus]
MRRPSNYKIQLSTDFTALWEAYRLGGLGGKRIQNTRASRNTYLETRQIIDTRVGWSTCLPQGSKSVPLINPLYQRNSNELDFGMHINMGRILARSPISMRSFYSPTYREICAIGLLISSGRLFHNPCREDILNQ